MMQRTGVKVTRPFHTFDRGLIDVVIALLLIVVTDHLIDVVTIGGQTPAQRTGQTFQSTFPLFTLFWLQVRVTAKAAIELPQIRCFERRTVGSDGAVAVDELPRCAALPGAVRTKLRVIIITHGTFERKITDLLLGRNIHAGVVLSITISNVVSARLGTEFLPVCPRVHGALPNLKGVTPLQVVLVRIIKGGRSGIWAVFRIVVIVFGIAITTAELGRVNPLLKT